MTSSAAPSGDFLSDLRDPLPAPAETASEALEEAAFASGAALAELHMALRDPALPAALLRDRMALRAALACTSFTGRRESEAELRDTVHLLRPGDLPGPAGEICEHWRGAVARGVRTAQLKRVLPGDMVAALPDWLDGAPKSPVARAGIVLQQALAAFPREESAALVLADATLARAQGQDHLMPLLAAGLKRADLRRDGAALRLACHRAITASVTEALRMAIPLTRRADRLRAVAPKLRARGAAAAVHLFLSRDALSPSLALTAPGLDMSDRAARRFCDRLVELGVVRELTGRPSFRLYGL